MTSKLAAKPKTKAKLKEVPKVKLVESKPEAAVKPRPPGVDTNSKLYQSLQNTYGVITGRHVHNAQKSAPVYSTGCLVLDLAMRRKDPIFGNGGIPERNVIELYGPTGVGKTITLFSIIAQIQKRGKICAVCFSEEPYMEFAEMMGVDIDALIVIDAWSERGKFVKDKKTKKQVWDPRAIREERANLAETVLSQLANIAKNEEVGLIAIDSIKGLVGSGQLYKKGDARLAKPRGFEEDEMAVRAKFVEKFLNRVKKRKDAIVIMTNHSSQAITTGKYGLPDRVDGTCGGGFKEFESVYRIKVTSSKIPDAAEHPEFKYKMSKGVIMRYKLVKARWGGKDRKVSTHFFYHKLKPKFVAPHFDLIGDILKCARILGLVKYEGGWYRWGKNQSSHGPKQAALHLKKNPELLESLQQQILARGEEVFELNVADEDFSKSIEMPMDDDLDDDDDDFEDDDDD